MIVYGYQGVSLFSRIIRFVTRSKYSHVAIGLRDGTVVEALATKGVVHARDFKENHTPGTKVDVFQLKDDTGFDYDAASKYALAQVGKRYDFRAIRRFGTRHLHVDPNKLFCSEYGCRYFLAGGRELLTRVNPEYISPHWMLTSPELELTSSKVV